MTDEKREINELLNRTKDNREDHNRCRRVIKSLCPGLRFILDNTYSFLFTLKPPYKEQTHELVRGYTKDNRCLWGIYVDINALKWAFRMEGVR